MTDTERQQWIDNDEGLYRMQRRASNRRTWLRENRAIIDEVAGNVMRGDRPAHYLEYGGNGPRQFRPTS